MVEKRSPLYLIFGFALTALAALGIVLPLLPTTPLLLLAAACFARSSVKCHRWLLNHRVFGPIIRNWNENRCIPLKAKITAVVMIILFGGYAVGFAVENLYLRIAGGMLCLIGLISVLRIPVCRKTGLQPRPMHERSSLETQPTAIPPAEKLKPNSANRIL